MAKGKSWSLQEVAATVADYMQMLQQELAGQRYNKAAHRRELVRQLDERTLASVEMKHQNISAVLRDLGRPWIGGYKPFGNYQLILAEEVELWLSLHPELDRLAAAAVDQPAVAPAHFDYQDFLIERPSPANVAREPTAQYQLKRPALLRDYAAREANNRQLGLAGEILVLGFERQRLISYDCGNLADKVEHVSQTQGDGLGYDILSYEPSGRERLIEVKTTAFAMETPFYATRNEVDFSRDYAEAFILTRVFDFRKSAKAFELPGAIAANCQMDAVSYVCRI